MGKVDASFYLSGAMFFASSALAILSIGIHRRQNKVDSSSQEQTNQKGNQTSQIIKQANVELGINDTDITSNTTPSVQSAASSRVHTELSQTSGGCSFLTRPDTPTGQIQSWHIGSTSVNAELETLPSLQKGPTPLSIDSNSPSTLQTEQNLTSFVDNTAQDVTSVTPRNSETPLVIPQTVKL